MSKKEVYRLLAKMYGWTFDEISRMTPEQQYDALVEDEPGTMTFRSMKEYEQWIRLRTS